MINDTSIRIVCLGDSVTSGYPYTDNCPADNIDKYSWTNSVRNALGVVVYNKGIGGQTTTELLARFDTDVLANNPTHCIFMGGVNDAYKPEKGVTLAQSKANLVDFISRCVANNIVPIIGILNPTDLYSSNMAYKTMCDQIRAYQIDYCTTNNIASIDFYYIFYDNVSSTVIKSQLSSDLLHPNVEGYSRMGWQAVKTLKTIIPKFYGQDQSMANYIINSWGTGEAPKRIYAQGEICFNKKPAKGDVAGWICTAGGQPGQFGMLPPIIPTTDPAMPVCRLIDTNDPFDYWWNVGWFMFYKASSTSMTIYRVTKAGYSNVHPVASERATFQPWTSIVTNS